MTKTLIAQGFQVAIATQSTPGYAKSILKRIGLMIFPSNQS
jgi:hypothetical protein